MHSNQSKMMLQLDRMEKQLNRLAFNIDMETVDIYSYFPAKNNDMLMQSMSNEDGQFDEKRKQFEYMLYTCITTQKTQKQPFGDALKNLIFSRNYVSTHRWPSARYKLFTF